MFVTKQFLLSNNVCQVKNSDIYIYIYIHIYTALEKSKQLKVDRGMHTATRLALSPDGPAAHAIRSAAADSTVGRKFGLLSFPQYLMIYVWCPVSTCACRAF